jgi:hypothetical protein
MKTRKAPRSELEITILKQGTSSKKVLSCSFFTMADAYRKVEQYERNLQKFLQQKKVLKGFETRIYTDDSGKEFALKAAKNDPTVSVYHFNYSPLREKIGHIGTFGTLIRFLPLFESGLETVWVSDIDIPDSYLDPSYITCMKTKNVNFAYHSYTCYDKKVYKQPYTIVANKMISFITFPKQLFTKFINQLVHPTKLLQEKIDILNEAMKKRKKPYSKIPYGIDELFLNTIIYNYLIDHNTQCYIIKNYLILTYKLLDHNNLLTDEESEYVYLYVYKNRSSLFNKIKHVLKTKLPLILEKHPCVKETLDQLDFFKTSFIKHIIKKGAELEE